MARRIRLDGPAVAHHVMLRGLEGAPIFLDADDRQDFVDRLARLLPTCNARCFAWALLTNHVHLVLQTDSGALTRVMRRLNTGYAVRFNRSRGRRGYLFMDRFRSRIVESDADLVGLIRYVHSNPLEAGLVRSLDALARYPWCGHGALMGARPAWPFEAVGAALSLFDEEPAQARSELLSWMARSPGPDASAPAAAPPIARATQHCAREEGSLPVLLRAVARHYRLERDELRSGAKRPHIARARAVAAYVAVVELGEAGATAARALGVGRAAISAALDRGRRAMIEDGFEFAANGPCIPGGESEI